MLRYREEALKWLKEKDPYSGMGDLTLDMLNEERTVYLVSDDDAESVDEWIEENYMNLLDFELSGHFPDDEISPEPFSVEDFLRWFQVEVHSVVVDTVEDEELFDDGDE